MRALWAVDHVVKYRSMCFRGPHAEFIEVLTLEYRPSRRRRVEISVATRVRGYGLSLNLGGGPDNEIKIQFILDILEKLNISNILSPMSQIWANVLLWWARIEQHGLYWELVNWQSLPPIDQLDQNLGVLVVHMRTWSLHWLHLRPRLFCIKNKQNPTKPTE